MVLTEYKQVARVVAGKIEIGAAVMVQLKNGDIQRAIVCFII